jgi:hypothetical protein
MAKKEKDDEVTSEVTEAPPAPPAPPAPDDGLSEKTRAEMEAGKASLANLAGRTAAEMGITPTDEDKAK